MEGVERNDAMHFHLLPGLRTLDGHVLSCGKPRVRPQHDRGNGQGADVPCRSTAACGRDGRR